MIRIILLVVSALGVFAQAAGAAAQAAPAPAWSEAFASLDQSEWQIQLYSFPANGCNMTAEQVSVHDNLLSLSVLQNPKRTETAPKMCNAGEVGSNRFFEYGLFVVDMKAPAIPGGVSAFFLMNRYQPAEWEHREIDFEFLGSQPENVQMTTHDFQNGGRDWKSAATTQGLGFDFSEAEHEYAILWTADAVTWFVDKKPVHRETHYVPHEPLQIRMNIYLGDPQEPGITQWLGQFDPSKIPAHADYRNIRYYPLAAMPQAYGN